MLPFSAIEKWWQSLFFLHLSNSPLKLTKQTISASEGCVYIHVLLALMMNSFCLYFRNQYFANLISCFTQRTDTNDGTFSSKRERRHRKKQDLFSRIHFCFSSSLSISSHFPMTTSSTSSFQLPRQQNVYWYDKIDDDKCEAAEQQQEKQNVTLENNQSAISSTCFHFTYYCCR